MLQSFVIETSGVFLGAAIPQDRGFRFVATHERTRGLDGSVWPSLGDIQRVARTLYQTGTLPRSGMEAVAAATLH